jgi:hypothetical protein
MTDDFNERQAASSRRGAGAGLDRSVDSPTDLLHLPVGISIWRAVFRDLDAALGR